MSTRISGEPELQLSIDGQVVAAHAVSGQIEISSLFVLKVDAHQTGLEAFDPEERVGKPAKLVIQPVVGPPLTVLGMIWCAETSTVNEAHEGVLHHEFEIRPRAATMAIGRDHRYFQEKNVQEIVKTVIDAALPDLDFSFDLGGSYRKREYTTQWGESDWEFIERLLREEGISYRFDFEDEKTQLVFFDDSTTVQAEYGGPISSAALSGLEADQEMVSELSVRWAATPGSITLRDYDPKKPALDLEVSAKQDERWPRYDFPGRYALKSHGSQLAQRRLESLRSKRSLLRGVSNTTRLWPGRSIEIEACPFATHGHAVVTALELDIQMPRVEVPGRARIVFEAIPSATRHRPARSEEHAAIAAVQTGFVVGPSGKELHTDDAGYVRARFPWDRTGKQDETASTFMRVGQFALGQSMVRPRIGWEVLVEHHSGDADLPMIVSHLYDGAHPTPYSLPANKTRTAFQTATTPGGGSSNEIRFEDAAGGEEIFLNASKNMAVAIGDTKTKKVGNNHDHAIGANSKTTVGSTRSIGVTANQVFQVGSSETLTVSGKRETGITGGDTVTIAASRSLTTTMGRTIQAKSSRKLTVGANMMDISALGVNRAVLGSASVSVGGAWISAAAAGLANMTGGAAAETVGGAKLQLGAGGVTLTVKGALAETVGGAYVTAAGGNFGETATGSLTFLVGGAFSINTPSIEIDAESEITIVVGGATSLKITSGSIEVSSPLIPTPAGVIAKDGSQIHHNP